MLGVGRGSLSECVEGKELEVLQSSICPPIGDSPNHALPEHHRAKATL
jgi:hypothetical protein